MNINPEDYPKAISHLKDKKAIVVLIVDLTDFPGSVWPNILDLIGSDKRYGDSKRVVNAQKLQSLFAYSSHRYQWGLNVLRNEK